MSGGLEGGGIARWCGHALGFRAMRNTSVTLDLGFMVWGSGFMARFAEDEMASTPRHNPKSNTSGRVLERSFLQPSSRPHLQAKVGTI